MDIHVVPVDWSTHQHQLNEVRDAVFVKVDEVQTISGIFFFDDWAG